ncbi:MAG: response regulator [Dehalococcoidia bacterium]|nr:response regulator [Dehalococcoidia bacterium]
MPDLLPRPQLRRLVARRVPAWLRPRHAVHASERPGPWRGSGLILVVDDEEVIRLVTARALEYAGFEVTTAADGREALALFTEHASRVRLVLLDMTMPVMGGDQVFDAIAAVRPDARVVLMSGYGREEATELFGVRPLAGFIQKPFDLPALTSAVRAALGE